MATTEVSLNAQTWTRIARQGQSFTATCNTWFRYAEVVYDQTPDAGIDGHLVGPDTEGYKLISEETRGGYIYARLTSDRVPAGVVTVSTEESYGSDFVFQVRTTSANEAFTLPCGNAGAYSASIDWGDGSAASAITSYNDADLSHTYSHAGDHIIKVTGTLPWVYFNNGGHKTKLRKILNWGTVSSASHSGSYYGCANLDELPEDGGFTGGITCVSMFRDCSGLTSIDGSAWPMSTVTDTSYMFAGCSKITSVDFGTGTLAATTTCSNMFNGCAKLANVNASNWTLASATTTTYMFYGCPVLTSIDLSSLDTTSLTVTNRMFTNDTLFSSIDTGSADFASLADAALMFYGCAALSDIDTSAWDLSSLTNGTSMFQGSGFNQASYDILLTAIGGITPQSGVTFHAGTAKYGAAVASIHTDLTTTYTWTITDGGPA